jgi:hypothetical protein
MIAVISDIHDNLANLKTALDYSKSKNVSALFVLGDITNSETLAYLSKNFDGQIYLVHGNMELYEPSEPSNYKNITDLGRKGDVIEIGSKLVGLCHEPYLADDLIKKGAQIIFYGHTHKPWSSYAPYSPKTLIKQTEALADKEEIKKGVKLVNPGNISNTLYSASFALWNEITDELELKII